MVITVFKGIIYVSTQVVIPHGSHVVMDVDFQSNLSDEISVKK